MMLHLARGFSKYGMKTDLILSSMEGKYINLIPKDVRVINLNSRMFFSDIPKLIKYFKHENCKLILSTWRTNIASLVLKAIHGSNINVIIRQPKYFLSTISSI